MSRLLRLMSLVLLIVALAACSPAASDVEDTTTTSEADVEQSEVEEPAVEEPEAEEAAAEEPAADVPQVLTMNYRLGTTQLDPAVEDTSGGQKMLSTVYDRLVVTDTNLELVPQLAVDWDTSEDGLTWTFYLREGVKFHDGTNFNAEAVKINFDRVRDPESLSRHAADYSMVESIDVIDEYTVAFTLSYPFAAFIRSVAMPGGMIACPSAMEEYGEDFGQHGCGSGPFTVSEFQPEEVLEVVRFDDYWRGPAKLEKIVFTSIADDQARVSALLAGDTDFETVVPFNLAPLLEEDENITVVRGPALMVEYIGFVTSEYPFDDKRVRQAVGYAIDMDAVIENVMGGVGFHASQPISPLVYGYDPSLTPTPYDVEQAKSLLAEAGWEDANGDGVLEKDGQNFETTFCIMDLPQMIRFVEVVQAYLKDVGIEAEIQVLDWGAYLDGTAKGICPMFVLGEGADTGDADSILWTEFHSSMIPTGNRTYYNNPEVDQLIEDQRKELDDDARLEKIHEALGMIMDDMPWVLTFNRESLIAYNNKVKDFEINPSTSYMDFHPIYIGE